MADKKDCLKGPRTAAGYKLRPLGAGTHEPSFRPTRHCCALCGMYKPGLLLTSMEFIISGAVPSVCAVKTDTHTRIRARIT